MLHISVFEQLDHFSCTNRIPTMNRTPPTFSDSLRQEIKDCGETRYQISQETGIDQATLSRFMHKKGGLSIPVLDRLADCLGIQIITTKKPKE